MRHKTVYLAGGMTGLSLEEANEWRRHIKDLIEDVAPHVSIVNPIDHCWFDSVEFGFITEREAMELDLYKLSKSELMIVNISSAPNSIGTNIEIGYAVAKGIPILALNESGIKLHSWHKDLMHKVFTNMDDLIAYYVRHFLYDD